MMKNILFLLPDQHRSDWFGFNSDLPLETPNIDKIANNGIRFTNAHCTSPLCAPSRATLATGRSYDRCGVINNQQNLPLEYPTYYQILREAGYEVLGVGKFDLHKNDYSWGVDGSNRLKEWGFTQGIDNEGKFDGSRSYKKNNHHAMGPYLAYLEQLGIAEEYILEHDNDNGKETFGAYRTCVPEEAYCDNWLTNNGLNLLRNIPQHKPWHLVVNFTGPHPPFDVTDAMRDKWKDKHIPLPKNAPLDSQNDITIKIRQNYASMIENIDFQVGRFIDLVAERGQLENTLIVYASDHGEMLGDHGSWGKSTWHKEATKVPLIVSGPGVQKGVISNALVGLHDLAATFAELTGSSENPSMDGRSILPVLSGDNDKHHDYLISGLNDWRMLFDGRYKAIFNRNESPHLYDLENDQSELHNIAENNQEVISMFYQFLSNECPEFIKTL